jgi:ketosteroid isomerase-like protein
MRHFFSVIAASALATLACASSPVFSQQAPATSETIAAQQQVLAAEDEYIAAQLSRDEEALRKLIDDKFVQNSPAGTTSGKNELIQSVLAGKEELVESVKLRMLGQTVRERSVLVEDDVALIFGTADLRFGGPGQQERTSSQRYTSTYIQRGNQWRLLSLQMQQRADDELQQSSE